MNTTLNREDTREAFRRAMLECLDQVALATFPGHAYGATDADLPRLFRALDEQVDVLAQRYNVTLQD